MASVSVLNPTADVLRKSHALAANCNAAKGLQDVIKSNLGPRGTLKMLVGGGGQVKITKDGAVLLHEMQIQHPTASMIARAATAQDAITGDGTTSNVLLVGEIMKFAERHIAEGVHPRLLCQGLELARNQCVDLLQKFAVEVTQHSNREILTCVARTSLRTKLDPVLADQLTDIVVEAVLCVRQPLQSSDVVMGAGSGDTQQDTSRVIDLHMVEVMHMKQRQCTDSRLIKGMVMDHGCRHPDMPKRLNNVHILTCNVSLEYEKTEVNSSIFYSSASQREKMVDAERRFVDAKVQKIIDLKRQVCTAENGSGFVVLNQKGIDPPALDMLARDGIMALRRVKRRNMERLVLACGGEPVNSVEDLRDTDLGFAETVYEQSVGEEKYTFVEGVKNPMSCAVLIKGPNEHSIAQMKDAVRDGLRAVKNCLDDGLVVPGAGAFSFYGHNHLMESKKKVSGKARLGVEIFANALLVIPKTLAQNSGIDPQECVLTVLESYEKDPERAVGVDVYGSGQGLSPQASGIWDNYRVLRHMLSIAPALAQQLLLTDEIIKSGKRQMARAQ